MLEITVQKKYEKKRKILASEVNDKAIKKTDVNELLKQITDAEHSMDAQVTNKSVKNLMELYQKAIEYYSALENECYHDFLTRMTMLFKREDVQKALAQPDEEEKKAEVTEETPAGGDQVKMDNTKPVTQAHPAGEGNKNAEAKSTDTKEKRK